MTDLICGNLVCPNEEAIVALSWKQECHDEVAFVSESGTQWGMLHVFILTTFSSIRKLILDFTGTITVLLGASVN